MLQLGLTDHAGDLGGHTDLQLAEASWLRGHRWPEGTAGTKEAL